MGEENIFIYVFDNYDGTIIASRVFLECESAEAAMEYDRLKAKFPNHKITLK